MEVFLSSPAGRVCRCSSVCLAVMTPFCFILKLLTMCHASVRDVRGNGTPFTTYVVRLIVQVTTATNLSKVVKCASMYVTDSVT